jgi:hypothetical protein
VKNFDFRVVILSCLEPFPEDQFSVIVVINVVAVVVGIFFKRQLQSFAYPNGLLDLHIETFW